MNKLIPPVYDGKESINSYQRKVNNFLLEVKKQNYGIITDFFNKLFGEENTKHSLTLFKNILHDNLIKKISDNKQVFEEYTDFFKKKYNIDNIICLK